MAAALVAVAIAVFFCCVIGASGAAAAPACPGPTTSDGLACCAPGATPTPDDACQLPGGGQAASCPLTQLTSSGTCCPSGATAQTDGTCQANGFTIDGCALSQLDKGGLTCCASGQVPQADGSCQQTSTANPSMPPATSAAPAGISACPSGFVYEAVYHDCMGAPTGCAAPPVTIPGESGSFNVPQAPVTGNAVSGVPNTPFILGCCPWPSQQITPTSECYEGGATGLVAVPPVPPLCPPGSAPNNFWNTGVYFCVAKPSCPPHFHVDATSGFCNFDPVALNGNALKSISLNDAGPCKNNSAPRRAFVGDDACVTVAAAAQTLLQNSVAPSHTQTDGTCLPGYAWRLYGASDHVCVSSTSPPAPPINCAAGFTRDDKGKCSAVTGNCHAGAVRIDGKCIDLPKSAQSTTSVSSDKTPPPNNGPRPLPICLGGAPRNPITGNCEPVCEAGETQNVVTGECCPAGTTPGFGGVCIATPILNPTVQLCLGSSINPITGTCNQVCQSGESLNPLSGLCEPLCAGDQTRNVLTGECCPVGTTPQLAACVPMAAAQPLPSGGCAVQSNALYCHPLANSVGVNPVLNCSAEGVCCPPGTLQGDGCYSESQTSCPNGPGLCCPLNAPANFTNNTCCQQGQYYDPGSGNCATIVPPPPPPPPPPPAPVAPPFLCGSNDVPYCAPVVNSNCPANLQVVGGCCPTGSLAENGHCVSTSGYPNDSGSCGASGALCCPSGMLPDFVGSVCYSPGARPTDQPGFICPWPNDVTYCAPISFAAFQNWQERWPQLGFCQQVQDGCCPPGSVPDNGLCVLLQGALCDNFGEPQPLAVCCPVGLVPDFIGNGVCITPEQAKEVNRKAAQRSAPQSTASCAPGSEVNRNTGKCEVRNQPTELKIASGGATPGRVTPGGGSQVQQINPGPCGANQILHDGVCICDPASGLVLMNGTCVARAQPPPGQCSIQVPGGSVYCAPLTDLTCPGSTQSLPSGGCCPPGSFPTPNGTCVTPGGGTCDGGPTLCCPAQSMPNFTTGACMPTPPSPTQNCQVRGGTLYCAAMLGGGCPQGSTASNGLCLANGPTCPNGNALALCCPGNSQPDFGRGICCQDGKCTLPGPTCSPNDKLLANGLCCPLTQVTSKGYCCSDGQSPMPSGQCCPTGSTEKDGKCVAPPGSSAPRPELKILPGGAPSGVTPRGNNPGQNINCLGDAVLVNGVCQIPTDVCTGGAGPEGKCQCSGGATSQPGFQCCPYGTMLNSSGQCQPLCPNGATDPDAAGSCALGVFPNLINDQSYCIDLATLAEPVTCLKQSLLVTGICPAGWTKQATPQYFNIPICMPTAAAQACEKQGMQVGTDGSCQSICGAGSWGYAIAQCCPAGQVGLADGQCGCAPGATMVDGKCRPAPKIENKQKETGTSSQTSAGITVCPNGMPVIGPAANCPQQVGPTCGRGQYPGPDFTCKSCPAGQLPYYSEARKLWVCVASAPSNCQSSGSTLYCAPQGGGSCPPSTVPFNGGSCLGPQLTCPSGVASMCCPGLAVPNFNTGACCSALQVPDSKTGQCVCAPGTNLVDGKCVVPQQCPAGYTLLPTGGCCPNDEVQDGGCVAPNPPPPPPQNCAPGYSLGTDGMCHRISVGIVCPPHTGEIPSADGRSCVCPPFASLGPTGACQCGGGGRLAGSAGCGPHPIPCAPAQKTTSGQCCPDGTTAQGNSCTAICQPGQKQWPDGTCSSCRPGQQLEPNGNCGPILTPPPSGGNGCGPGQVFNPQTGGCMQGVVPSQGVPVTQPSTTQPTPCAPGVPPGTAGCYEPPPVIPLQGRTNQPNPPAFVPLVQPPSGKTTPTTTPALAAPTCGPGMRRIGDRCWSVVPPRLPCPPSGCGKEPEPRIEGRPSPVETPRLEPRETPRIEMPRVQAPRVAPRVAAPPQWKFRLPLLGRPK